MTRINRLQILNDHNSMSEDLLRALILWPLNIICRPITMWIDRKKKEIEVRNRGRRYLHRAYGESSRLAKVKNKSATFEEIAHAMHDISLKVRLAAISHPKVDEDHISIAFEVGCPELLRAAVAHPKATLEHLEMYRHQKLLDMISGVR